MSTRARSSIATSRTPARKRKSDLPAAWTEERVQRVIDFYDNQPDDEATAEIEAALDSPEMTVVSIPKALVPAVKQLIARDKALRAEALRVVRRTQSARKQAGRTAAVRKSTSRKPR